MQHTHEQTMVKGQSFLSYICVGSWSVQKTPSSTKTDMASMLTDNKNSRVPRILKTELL